MAKQTKKRTEFSFSPFFYLLYIFMCLDFNWRKADDAWLSEGSDKIGRGEREVCREIVFLRWERIDPLYVHGIGNGEIRIAVDGIFVGGNIAIGCKICPDIGFDNRSVRFSVGCDRKFCGDRVVFDRRKIGTQHLVPFYGAVMTLNVCISLLLVQQCSPERIGICQSEFQVILTVEIIPVENEDRGDKQVFRFIFL